LQIIDKNKDYYDYCQFEYGPVDKTATYDRRGSKVITEEDFFRYCYKDRLYYDKNDNLRYSNYSYSCSEPLVLLEVGNIQNILKLSNCDFKWINQENNEFTIRGDISILYKFDNGVHICREAVTLTHFKNKREFRWPYRVCELKSAQDIEVNENHYEHAIENPVLRDTPIPAIIPARDFYIALDNYFRSAYNDKTIDINNSDIDKAINHGFDKKTSFRHPIK